MGGFTGNTSGIRKVLTVFVIAFIGAVAGWCTKGHTAELDGTTVSLGQVFESSTKCTFTSLTISQEFNNRQWLGSLHTHGSGLCTEEMEANIGFSLVRTAYIGRWAFGIGGALWEHGDVIVGPLSVNDDLIPPRVSEDIQLTAALLIRGHFFHDRVVLDIPFHFSTGGSTHYNRGLNLVSLGVRF